MAAMKRFTSADIATRLKQRVLQKENLRVAVDDQVIDSLLQATSEELADAIRYKEYLTRENVWDYMRNITSAVGMGSLVGYQPRRKRSAITNLIFAVDPNIRAFGAYSEEVYNEYLNDDGTLDVLRVEPGVVGYENLRSLNTYPGVGTSSSLEIPKHTIVQDRESEIQYITLTSRAIKYAGARVLDKEPTIDSTSRWARIPCIQGRMREYIARGVRGREFERVTINSPNVEDMRQDYSRTFLIVSVRPPGSDEFEPWDRLQDIREAGPYDKAFMVETELDYSRVHIVFGNGISGKILPPGTDVKINYLETRGSQGNIDASQRVTEIRTNIQQIYAGVPLYVTNLNPIANGADEDTLSDIKSFAPLHYLTVDSVGSEEAYVSVIENLPDIRRARVYRGSYRRNQADTERDTVSFTAITEDGESPNELDILRRVRMNLGKRTSPTDILQFEPPERIEIAYNIRGYINDITTPLQHYVNEVRRILYTKYRIRELEFKQPIFHIDVLTALRNGIEPLESAMAFPEAVISSEFYIDMFLLGDEGSMRIDFNFNSSLSPFKEFKNDVEHVLRVDFIVRHEPIRHRSRTLLMIPNPDAETEDEEYVIRQFGLLDDIVLTPERVRAILNDSFGIYKEKVLTVWHWVNRTELVIGDPLTDDEEDYDIYFDTSNDMQFVTRLQDKLDAVPSRNYKIMATINEDTQVFEPPYYLYYSEVSDLEAMSSDTLRKYYERYRDWKESEWAQDPDCESSFIEDDYFGSVPTMYVPDSTHKAPIELTFRTSAAEEGEQAGAGSIFISPSYEGRGVEFIPSTVYRGVTEDGKLVPSDIQVYATPRNLDLHVDSEFGIFNLPQANIKVDLR
ncbi:MAG: baseplate J/gp47 family protein, partial [Actinobacteria bacterium]|nr:baseplate J/gp47 family protein [Actinomycetota bacterium]